MAPEVERSYSSNCRLHQKLFTFLQSYNVSATLVTQLDFFDHYNPTVRNLDSHLLVVQPKPDEPVAGQLTVVQSHSLKDAVEKTVTNAGQKKNKMKKNNNSNSSSKFTLIHSNVDAFAPVDRRKQFKELDESISRIFQQSVAVNGLMVVIFAGTRNPLQNGMCLVRVNQQQID